MSLTSYRAAPPRDNISFWAPAFAGASFGLSSRCARRASRRLLHPAIIPTIPAPEAAPDRDPEPAPFGAKTPREGKAQDRSRARPLCSKPPLPWEARRRGLFRPAKIATLGLVFQAEQTSRMSDKPAIRPDAAVGAALKAVARDILAEALAALDDPEKSDATAVHDYRKAMKRWRALLRLVIPFIGDDGERLRVEARDLARELAGARDAQSALDALDDLKDPDDTLAKSTRASLRARIEEIRAAAEETTLTDAMRG